MIEIFICVEKRKEIEIILGEVFIVKDGWGIIIRGMNGEDI